VVLGCLFGADENRRTFRVIYLEGMSSMDMFVRMRYLLAGLVVSICLMGVYFVHVKEDDAGVWRGSGRTATNRRNS
jgi:hypothetical protein